MFASNKINRLEEAAMKFEETHVLIVDDDPRLLRGLERHFDDAGFIVTTAVSAAEAQVILTEYLVDAIVCDNQMPGTSGKRFLATVSRDYPEVALFMLSGDVTKHDEWLIEQEIGVDGLFHKPCNPVEILAAIKEVVTAKEMEANGSTNAPSN